MKINMLLKRNLKTHEGAPAKQITPEQQLKRSLMACMLWEDTFYEDGQSIADRIASLVPQVEPQAVADMAIEAREKMKLRHAPLWVVREMARHDGHKALVADTLAKVIQRADELAEFLALYWKDGKQPVSKQVKKGLAQAFTKFDAYQLAKYNRDGIVKLRDVLFMCHAKPLNREQEETWKQLIDGTLPAPDTWEVALSAGKDKKETWERLLSENKLGGLALLRNLRNMSHSNVDEQLVFAALDRMKTERILPFRFIVAARQVPQWESRLEKVMLKCLEGREKLPGKTVLLVDVSGSMDWKISWKSDLKRYDAACGLAILARELCENVAIYSFSDKVVRIPDRHGFSLSDAIVNSQPHYGTYLGAAVKQINGTEKYDRLIVLTDEQSHDPVPDPRGRGYMLNLSSYTNGVGYGAWMHIDGWSEAVIDYINEYEKFISTTD
ncbi:MAG: TROVE domain-containing protein [Clostridiaceae bacterium]|nr:TROVE domain-containing protein [Clostridiaceae bacterium]